MTPFSLYEKTSAYGGVYVLFMVNRLQMLYLILIMPTYLVHPYMIWGIVAMGIFSQINLMMLSRWFASDYSAKGYQGFVQLFGERMVRFFAFAGLFLIVLKVTVITLGYLEIIHQFIFPSMNANWLILFILLASWYVAAQGMEKTIRFVVIAFLMMFWVIFLFFPFFLPPIAKLHHIYPLIPAEVSMHSWKALLFVWSSLSGPEYLICLAPWLSRQQKMLKYLTLGNAISVVEYLLLFIASLLFFGSDYLTKIKFPVVHMIRYLQSPVLERMDQILILLHLFPLVLIISILLLYFHGAIRIIVGKPHEPTTRMGLMASWIAILVCLIVVNEWFWQTGAEQNLWLDLQIWLGAFTFLLVPAVLQVAIKLKGRV
ncbi:GerAB/ArcD/ProY family transporter [Brevibacillus nitrificans]|uniref:GerAB/ArcD/ProY family transporter n=1 Tax=Brevibacillus nitrificans TaxID=651560 RepID=UPI00285EC090|nr:GerAB/ArcD/ProY family transporter [Brevibacillus nitrificans]MDR7319543.1 hypothetical protein [Brevibacillus nitrificans]